MTDTTQGVEMTGTDQSKDRKQDRSAISLPVFILTLLGTVIAVLGLFAAGDLGLVIVGLASVAVAAVLHVIGARQ